MLLGADQAPEFARELVVCFREFGRAAIARGRFGRFAHRHPLQRVRTQPATHIGGRVTLIERLNGAEQERVTGVAAVAPAVVGGSPPPPAARPHPGPGPAPPPPPAAQTALVGRPASP